MNITDEFAKVRGNVQDWLRPRIKETLESLDNLFEGEPDPFQDFAQSYIGTQYFPVQEVATDKLYALDADVAKRGMTLNSNVKAMLDEIEQAQTSLGKMIAVQRLSNSYIEPTAQDLSDHYRPFSTLSKHPEGDCDDYATFKSGLLMKSDFDDQDVLRVIGHFDYERVDGKPIAGVAQDDDATEPNHAVVIVRQGDSYFVMDNNLSGVYEIDPANPVVQANLFDRDAPDHKGVEVTMRLASLYSVKDADGQAVYAPERGDYQTAQGAQQEQTLNQGNDLTQETTTPILPGSKV